MAHYHTFKHVHLVLRLSVLYVLQIATTRLA